MRFQPSQFMKKVFLNLTFGSALVVGPSMLAYAGGGAHIVDDADIEEPGRCHVETWGTANGGRSGLGHLGVACTPGKIPALELGIATEYERAATDHGFVATPSFKWSLLSSETGVGVALSGNVQWNGRRNRFDAGDLIVPVSIPISEQIRVNLNAGWSHDDEDERRDAMFRGAQVEYAFHRQASVMAEIFRRQGARTGFQSGVRLTPGQGDMDIDVLYGHYTDGASTHAYTVGLTWRH